MPEKTLNPYVAFSREAGPHEGGWLVVAHTTKEAKQLAWQANPPVDDYFDLGILLIRDIFDALPLADQDKLRSGISHVIKNPTSCQACEVWAAGLTIDDKCGNCNEDPGPHLINLIKNWKENNQ